MLGLPLWALIVLVNLVAVVCFAVMVCDEVQPIVPRPLRPLVLLLILLVLVCFGAPLVLVIEITSRVQAYQRRRAVWRGDVA